MNKIIKTFLGIGLCTKKNSGNKKMVLVWNVKANAISRAKGQKRRWAIYGTASRKSIRLLTLRMSSISMTGCIVRSTRKPKA